MNVSEYVASQKTEQQAVDFLMSIFAQKDRQSVRANGEAPVANRLFDAEMFGCSFDPEIVRESILSSVYRAVGRFTFGNVLFLLMPMGNIVVFEASADKKLVNIFGRHHGSEDYDGEDSGDYAFWMNASSLVNIKDFIRTVPRVSALHIIKRIK